MAELRDIGEILDGVLKGLQNQKELNKLGLAGTKRILDRTRKGLDVDQRPFKGYSDSWAARREAEGLPTLKVDLQFDDLQGMLQNVTHEVDRSLTKVAIDIEDPQKKRIASYHDELGAGRSHVIRHWWGFNAEDEKKITSIIERDLENLLEKLVEEKS